jgi:hypothetical protein
MMEGVRERTAPAAAGGRGEPVLKGGAGGIRVRPLGQDHRPNQAGQFLAHRCQAGPAVGGDFVIFAGPAPVNPETRLEETGLFHLVQEGVEAARADGMALSPEVLAQPAAVNRPLGSQMQDHQPGQTLPERMVNAGEIIHNSNKDIYRLDNFERSIDFLLIIN